MPFSRTLLGLLLFASLSTFAPPASAHELLPQALLQYVQEHPDATAEDLQNYLDQNPNISSSINTKDPVQLIEFAKSDTATFWQNAWRFITLGIGHILSGIDHILFVLAIILTFVSIQKTLKLITSFTIAHSVTLILAGTGTLVLSSQIVEPMIAFSIAYVAVTSVFLTRYTFFRERGNKILSIFFFGLFHGLGFAGLLTELSIPPSKFVSSLLFFNVGIEIGQLTVIAVALPLLLFLRRTRWNDVGIKIIAGTIALLALLWTVERIVGALI